MHHNDLLAGKIDVLALLRALDEYILIKRDSLFPRYAPGTDIDLVVFDREKSLRRIIHYYNAHVAPEGELSITDSIGHCHADFSFHGMLDLRVDLIDDFDSLQNIAVKRSYLTKLFIDRQTMQVGEDNVYIPSPEDELTLRYLEYLEWFDRRPDKIKHLDYICQVEDEDLKRRFFANTHQYVQFKPRVWLGVVPDQQSSGAIQLGIRGRREALATIMTATRYLVSATLRGWAEKLKKRLR